MQTVHLDIAVISLDQCSVSFLCIIMFTRWPVCVTISDQQTCDRRDVEIVPSLYHRTFILPNKPEIRYLLEEEVKSHSVPSVMLLLSLQLFVIKS